MRDVGSNLTILGTPETEQLKQRITHDGFAILERVINPQAAQSLAATLENLPDDPGIRRRGGNAFARRNLLAVPIVAELAQSETLLSIARVILGSAARPVRGILFDKNLNANWVVPWHQDLSIAVEKRIELPGFGPWSCKAGVMHVHAPLHVLNEMITIRLHLDDCGPQSGPLRVISGSHQSILSPKGIAERSEDGPQIACCAKAGGAIVMRPLIVHASSHATSPTNRRVVHIEYAGCDLPGGLRWHADQAAKGTSTVH